jgi:hypothetical protein
MPGDLGTQLPLGFGYERGNPAVFPSALGFAAGGDGAEQPERLVVANDLLKQTSADSILATSPTSIR